MKKQSFKIGLKQEGETLLSVIAAELNISKKQGKKLLDSRMVFVNGRRIWMAKHSVKEGDQIEVHIADVVNPRPKRISILWQDKNYLIINKPPFTLTNADPDSIENQLKKQEKNPEICAVHRLDKETSGCLLFAKSAKAKAEAIPLFKNRKMIKIYRAVTVGHFPSSWKDIKTDIDGLISTTLVKTLDSNKHASYLELRIETGRTHQIRRHLADRRFPVMGDKKYGGSGNPFSVEQPRQMLHAYRLVFPHPASKEVIRATAPLPGDFKACLSKLNLQ